jgi:hypothetical protein
MIELYQNSNINSLKFGGIQVKPKNRVYKPPPDNIRNYIPNIVKHWLYISSWAIIDICQMMSNLGTYLMDLLEVQKKLQNIV